MSARRRMSTSAKKLSPGTAWGSQVSLHESTSWYPVFAKCLANGCSSLQLSKEVGKQSSELRINRNVRLYIWWRVVWDFTSQNNTSWRVVWDFTSHNLQNNTSWRVVWEFTHNNTSWRVVWDLASHNNTKGGVRPYIRGKWWLREVVTWLLHGVCFGEETGARNLVFSVSNCSWSISAEKPSGFGLPLILLKGQADTIVLNHVSCEG